MASSGILVLLPLCGYSILDQKRKENPLGCFRGQVWKWQLHVCPYFIDQYGLLRCNADRKQFLFRPLPPPPPPGGKENEETPSMTSTPLPKLLDL